jgi:hypothetical protein
MGKKKNSPSAGGTDLSAIRIGSRVRCTDDGVEGRIAWANAVAVKIKWDDGEEVTWKRGELASKPIEFLDAEQAEPAEQPPVDARREQAGTVETHATEPPATVVPEQAATAEMPVAERQRAVAPVEPSALALETSATELPGAEPAATQPATDGAPAPTTETAPAEPLSATLPGGFAIPKRQRKPKPPAEPKVKKLSALDAAAKVLAETGMPMTCKELIATMAAKGYWTSPGGRTPDATLNAAIIREVAVKGEQARFVKTGPGRFALRPIVLAPEPPGDTN